MSPQDPLTLSRQDLYELAWSKPLSELAADFGISDVALAKRCRKLGIPIPGRGYWARVAAGQAPRRPPLTQRENQPQDYPALSFSTPQEPAKKANTDSTSETAAETALRERIVVLQTAPGPDHNPASPAVKRTAMLLKRPWRGEITWNRGEKTGPVCRIDASNLVADRALRLADQLLTRASVIGWPFQELPKPEDSRTRRGHAYSTAPDAPVYGCLVVNGEALAFRIDERSRQVDHALTDDEKERKRRGQLYFVPRWDLVPTGELRLHLQRPDWNHAIKTWKDSSKRPLEDQVNTALLGLLDEAIDIKARREERRRAEIEERRRQELRRRQSERRSANAKLIHQLEAQAGAWLRARFLKSYVRAMKRTLGDERIETTLDKQPVDFLEWAEHYVAQLDPLSAVPHDVDLMDESLQQYGSDEGIHKTLGRLMGRHWQETWKLGGQVDSSEDPD